MTTPPSSPCALPSPPPTRVSQLLSPGAWLCVQVMLYSGSKIPAFSRECLKRGLAVVVVGFPAVPLLLGRVRFCLSAAHTREMLEDALAKIDEVADMTLIKYDKY